jgi:hypothetical protein
MQNSLVLITAICGFIGSVIGHGYVNEPVARGSRWRTNSSAPVNVDDNSLFCGGFAVSVT